MIVSGLVTGVMPKKFNGASLPSQVAMIPFKVDSSLSSCAYQCGYSPANMDAVSCTDLDAVGKLTVIKTSMKKALSKACLLLETIRY